MWIQKLTVGVSLACLCGISSCDKIKEVVGNEPDKSVPADRRAGLGELKACTVSEAKQWLEEPNVLVVLSFCNAENPPSVEMEPLLEKMASQYADTATILKIDTGASDETARFANEEHTVTVLPTLKFYLNNEELKVETGSQTEEQLDRMLKKFTSEIDTKLPLLEEPVVVQRTLEEMIKPSGKGDLPPGITREKIPSDGKTVTDTPKNNLLPDFSPPPERPQPSKPKVN